MIAVPITKNLEREIKSNIFKMFGCSLQINCILVEKSCLIIEKIFLLLSDGKEVNFIKHSNSAVIKKQIILAYMTSFKPSVTYNVLPNIGAIKYVTEAT